jgi:Bacterial regulatory helix-turn-helix protein, lysR family
MIDHDVLEPERLRAFVAVAETGNFTRAAERLLLTQPTVSMQVRRLEENIGRPLCERNAQFVRLTADDQTPLVLAAGNPGQQNYHTTPDVLARV